MSSDNKLIITLVTLVVTTIAVFLYVKHRLMRKKKEKKSNSSSNNNDGGAPDEVENQTSKPSPSTTLPLGQSYEVFLSFRGGDTRWGFTDHLYERLVDAGISVFRDDNELRVGETIGPELYRAIEASKISIPIISSNYASSKWCLNELVQILKCVKTSGQRVLPIFYKVEPSDVRHQKGGFGKAFKIYIKKHDFDGKLVQEWKSALAEVSSLKGWESKKFADGYEGKLVKTVVTRVFNELRKAILVVSDRLVGIEDPVKNIMRMIEAKPTDEVKIIGISGMGGIGKTTLAKVIYNKLSDNFEYRSFLSNIRETSSQHKGMEGLQKQVISDTLINKSLRDIPNVDEGITIIKQSFKGKKLLLLLDDVDKRDQLNKLAADPSWFGPQSVIIITTRNKEVIMGLESSMHYELNELDLDQSFQLFCKHAFGKDPSPSVELETIANDIIRTTGGLPLAIEVIGSLLFQKSRHTWETTLEKLKRIPNHKVQEKLRISYDALEHEEQQIFLDIACLPIKERMLQFSIYMWDDFGLYPEEGIQVLISLSLIKIGYKNELIIHDQLRDMGREIVRRESYHELGMRSRLWIPKEAIEVMQRKQGTEKVQALDLDDDEQGDRIEFTDEQFKYLTNLRFLKMRTRNLAGDFNNSLPELRWLELKGPLPSPFDKWFGRRRPGCHIDEFMATIHPKKLVVLDLSYCTFASWGQIELARRLKVLTLYQCNFTTTPDFSSLSELELLNLSRCKGLRKIHPSIRKLNKALRILDVRQCCELDELPIDVGEMEELRELLVDGTNIREIHISEGFITNLKKLSANNCQMLEHIPDSVGSLEMLQRLSLQNCKLLTKVPETIGKLQRLTELHLGGTRVTELPDSIRDLHGLNLLSMEYTPIKRLPTTIGMLTNLQALNLDHCRNLEWLPNLPCSLTSLKFHGDSMENLPDISCLTNLEDLKYSDAFERRNRALNLGKLNQLNTLLIFHSMAKDEYDYGEPLRCPQLVVSEDINLLLQITSSLVKLQVRECQTLRHLSNMSNLKRLSELRLEDCRGLMEINGLEGAESLRFLLIKGCYNLSKLSGLGISVMKFVLQSCRTLKSLPHLATAKNLKYLIIWECSNLVEISGLDGTERLQSLEICKCPSLGGIGDLSNLKILKTLELLDCERLSVVEGIDKLTSLQSLQFHVYNPNVKFPDLSMLRNLNRLNIRDETLVEIPGLQELKSLTTLDISGCKSLQILPDFSLFTNLEVMLVKGCENLTEIQALKNLRSFRYLDIHGCPLAVFPDLPERNVRVNK